MKLKLSFYLLTLLLSTSIEAQIVQNGNDMFYAKEFSKDISLFKAKTFLKSYPRYKKVVALPFL